MAPPTSSVDSGFWRDLELRFLQGQELQAHWEQTATGQGQWWLDGHPSDVDDCQALAALAAVALGHPSGQATWVNWLETLRTRRASFREHAAFTVAADLDQRDPRAALAGRRKIKTAGRIGTIQTFRKASASLCRILQSERQQHELIKEQPKPLRSCQRIDQCEGPRVDGDRGRRSQAASGGVCRRSTHVPTVVAS